jgi:tetratricopeptide (TPR) repeat protein
VSSIGWLALGLDSGRSARWFESLQSPSSPFGNYARGYANETLAVYHRDRDPTASRDAWLRATRANPNNPRYFNNLGMEELRLERTDEACAAFRRALELGMDEYFVLFNVGTCERRAGNIAAAEGYYDRLIARWPDHWESYSARGLVRVRLGRPQEALLDLDKALAMAPQDADTHYRRGLALTDLGRPEEARAAWERTLELDPSHRQARSRLLQIGGKKED